MPNAQYRQGDYAEKLVAATLKANGYLTVQSRGSKGHADIVAIKPQARYWHGPCVLLVQVKRGTVAAHSDWNALYELATAYGCLPVWVDSYAPGSGSKPASFRWRQITGWHNERSHSWPAQPWIIDEVIEHEGLNQT
jgi:hypothetical protein